MDPDVYDTAKQTLLTNARRMSRLHQAKIEQWRPVKAKDTEFIPGYVPYIGIDYFTGSTGGRRVLAYALSQNLRKDDSFACRWAEDWRHSSGDLALDRQNRAFAEKKGRASMHPFDTGHIPVLAAILRSVAGDDTGRCRHSIYPEMGATNLSKFSFRTKGGRNTTDSLESLRACWEWFSRREVQLLRPDYILCCGGDVHKIVSQAISAECSSESTCPTVIQISFPSARVINRYYRKPPRRGHLRAADIKKMMPADDLGLCVKRGPKNEMPLADVICRDEFYFAAMADRIAGACQKDSGA